MAAAKLQVVPELPPLQALEEENRVLHDQLAGSERDVRAWRVRYRNLERDKQAEAEADPLWALGKRVFVYQCKVCGHEKAIWTPERFRLLKPFLARPGLEDCLRAVAGAMADEWRRERGLTLFEDIFESRKKFERCLALTPSSWHPPRGMPS